MFKKKKEEDKIECKVIYDIIRDKYKITEDKRDKVKEYISKVDWRYHHENGLTIKLMNDVARACGLMEWTEWFNEKKKEKELEWRIESRGENFIAFCEDKLYYTNIRNEEKIKIRVDKIAKKHGIECVRNITDIQVENIKLKQKEHKQILENSQEIIKGCSTCVNRHFCDYPECYKNGYTNYKSDNDIVIGSLKKPPLGLRPKHIAEDTYRLDRAIEIVEATLRYMNEDKKVDIEWMNELYDLMLDLTRRDNK